MLHFKFILVVFLLLIISLHAVADENSRPAVMIKKLQDKIYQIQSEFEKHPASLHDLNWVSLKVLELKKIEDVLDETNSLAAQSQFAEQEEIEFIVRYREAQQVINKEIYFDFAHLLEVHDWFRTNLFGLEANSWAVAIVTHLDDFPDFQIQILTKLRHRFSLGETKGVSVALLTDHLALKNDTSNARHLQPYGTQGMCVGVNQWLPLPTEEESCLDLRRSQLGLSPEKFWIEEMSIHCR